MTVQEAKEFQEVRSRCESNTHQIKEMKSSISEIQNKQNMMHEMNTNIKLIAQSMTSMQQDVIEVRDSQKNLENKVAVIENRPAKETNEIWMKVKVAIITALATGIVAYLLGGVLQ